MDSDFDYAEEFNKLDNYVLKQDIAAVITDSRDWRPEVPSEPQLWQDPVPPVENDLVDDADVPTEYIGLLVGKK